MNENDFKKFDDLVESLKKEAVIDLTIHLNDTGNYFNFVNLSVKWLDKSITYKPKVHAKKQIMKQLYQKLFKKYSEQILYQSMSEKALKEKIESDSEYQYHEKELFYVQLIYDYCIEIKDALRAKCWEVKEQLAWQKFIGGE